MTARKLKCRLTSYTSAKGDQRAIQTAVKVRSTIFLTGLQDCINIYQSIHIIEALTTGAHSHTKNEKVRIVLITQITRNQIGKYANKKLTKIIQSVILKPLTAIK